MQSVSYKLDGAALAPDQTGQPWGINWDTTTTANGPHTLTVISRDAAGNPATINVPVTVDNGGIDIQAQNGGATPGFEETGDTIVYSFGTAIQPASVLAGWDGTPTPVTVKFNADDPLYDYNDTVVIRKPDDSAIPALGLIDLGQASYVGLYEPGGRFIDSAMTLAADGKSITVQLGTPNAVAAFPGFPAGTMTWKTSPLVLKVGGQPFCSCRVVEGVAAGSAPDREF